jgi:glutamate/tyrosine decarboxylase-like PLP-dependent enzyme
VKSINVSGHKFGLAPLGVGWIVWRDAADLPDDLVFNVNYLGGTMPTFALNFSRPGGQIAVQYYNFLRLGREGYRKIHLQCHAISMYLAGEIESLGPLKIICSGDPREGIPAVSWKLKEGVEHGFTLFDLADRLRTKGGHMSGDGVGRQARDGDRYCDVDAWWNRGAGDLCRHSRWDAGVLTRLPGMLIGPLQFPEGH